MKNNTHENQNGLRHRTALASTSTTAATTDIHTNNTPPSPNRLPKTPDEIALVVRDKTLLQRFFQAKEERAVFHLHKILGVACLCSFIYRFCHVGVQDGNFTPRGLVAFVVLHFLLNASSFLFDIPQRRIKDGGYRIWPEYRFHSLVFASRSLVCMLVIGWEQHVMEEKEYHHPYSSSGVLDYYYYVRALPVWHASIFVAIVLLTCGAADFGSYLQGREYQSHTVRDTDYVDPFEQWFASQAQMLLTGYCLVGIRRYTFHVVAVAIIQGNAFLMTLRRRNVASHRTLVATYGVMLLGAFWMVIWDDQYIRQTLIAAAYGELATILRMGCNINKYIVWSVLGLLWQYIVATHVVPTYNKAFWLVLFCVTKLISLALGLQRRARQPTKVKSTILLAVVLVSHAGLYAFLIISNYRTWRKLMWRGIYYTLRLLRNDNDES